MPLDQPRRSPHARTHTAHVGSSSLRPTRHGRSCVPIALQNFLASRPVEALLAANHPNSPHRQSPSPVPTSPTGPSSPTTLPMLRLRAFAHQTFPRHRRNPDPRPPAHGHRKCDHAARRGSQKLANRRGAHGERDPLHITEPDASALVSITSASVNLSARASPCTYTSTRSPRSARRPRHARHHCRHRHGDLAARHVDRTLPLLEIRLRKGRMRRNPRCRRAPRHIGKAGHRLRGQQRGNPLGNHRVPVVNLLPGSMSRVATHTLTSSPPYCSSVSRRARSASWCAPDIAVNEMTAAAMPAMALTSNRVLRFMFASFLRMRPTPRFSMPKHPLGRSF